MTTATWISLIVIIVGAAVVWGSLKNEVGNTKAVLAELRRDVNDSFKDQGRRLGKLETALKVDEEVKRALTGAVPVHVARETSQESDR